MQSTAGGYKPLTHAVEDVQRWLNFPFANNFLGQECTPWGMPCSNKLLASPQSVHIVSILLHVNLFCEPIIFTIY